jgi:mannose-6-phosphate isomerase-like protein (cupin superfamily)
LAQFIPSCNHELDVNQQSTTETFEVMLKHTNEREPMDAVRVSVPSYIHVLEGTMVIEVDGKPPREIKEGEAFMEVVGPWHRNRNPSNTDKLRYLLVFMGVECQPFVEGE